MEIKIVRFPRFYINFLNIFFYKALDKHFFIKIYGIPYINSHVYILFNLIYCILRDISKFFLLLDNTHTEILLK